MNILERKKNIGYYSGIFSIFFFLFFSFIAYIVSLNDYDPFTRTISKLGVTNNGSLYFIFGTIIGGILLSIYINFYVRNVIVKSRNNIIAVYLGIISGFALTGVAIIQDKPELIYKVGHTLSAGIFFTSMGFAIFFFSLDLRENYNPILRKLAYFGFFVCSIAVLHFFLSYFKDIIDIFGFRFTINAVWQKITVVSYIVWHVFLFLNLNRDKSLENLSTSS